MLRVDNSRVLNNLTVTDKFILPVVEDVTTTTPLAAGSLTYDKTTETIYSSTGTQWITPSGSMLPLPLTSIASLATLGDEMLYTTGPNVYATSPITDLARGFLTVSSSASQRLFLGLAIGTNVQAWSSSLDTLVTAASGPANQLIYTTGPGFTTTGIAPYIRTNILPLTSATALATEINAITGTVSTPDALVTVVGSQTVTETGVLVDESNNISGINNLSLTGNLSGITPAEITQLQNINGSTISSTQWGYLSILDQNVDTTSTPTFTGLSAGNQWITNVLTPLSATDAANKDYVDTVATTGAPPLDAVQYATAAVLPNSPTYTAVAETLTSTAGAGVALVVDGVTFTPANVGDRILVKNQADMRENGVYVITNDGSGASPWILTRSSDFNEAETPILAGTSVFVELSGAATNDASTWALQTTVNDIDPLTDTVVFVQIGGSQTFTAGQGIDSTALTGGTIQTSITTRLKYTANSLDLNTVTVGFGGTGQTTLVSNGVLVGMGTAPVDTSKAAPTGDFVGTTDSQTLTSKTVTSNTNNVTARALFYGSGAGSISTYAATTPATGQVLTATSSTVANWQSPSVYTRTVVAGASYNILSTDDIIAVTATDPGGSNVASTVTLPLISSLTTPKRFIVVDEGGGASVNNITISASVPNLIIGETSLVLQNDYNSISLYHDSGNKWFVG